MDQSESTAANLDRRSRRRWLQFSIRTMLVLITLICVALTIWVVPLERRRRAVDAIVALEGRVSFVSKESTIEAGGKSLLERWLPQAYVDEIEGVGLDVILVTDAGLPHLHGLTSLQGLHLDNTQSTDAGLANLKGLTGLQFLSLNNTQITDAGLAHLKGLTGLHWLHLKDIQVTDAGLASFRGLTGLYWLDLRGTKVTDAGVAKLRKALPNCQIFGP